MKPQFLDKLKDKGSAQHEKFKNKSLYGPSEQHSTNLKDLRPIQFSNYARVGLANFFAAQPERFLKRLAKGPPPQFRWLAWSFLASRLKSKVPRDYERNLKVGRSDENDKCKYEISKDVNRTFPYYPYFKDDASG